MQITNYYGYLFDVNSSASKNKTIDIDTPILDEKMDLLPLLHSNDEITIYGYSFAGWREVLTFAKKITKKVYDYSISEFPTKTLFNRKFLQSNSSFVETNCKTTLTSVVVENCLRANENKPLIPVIFCLSSSNSQYHFSVESIANKYGPNAPYKESISNSELRRIYKMCEESDIPLKVREIAKKTFYFAHVTFDRGGNVVSIEKTAAPWENTEKDPNRNLKWEMARKEKNKTKIKTKQKNATWRDWLQDLKKTEMLLV